MSEKNGGSISVDFEYPFAAVPNWLAQEAGLSIEALGCITYLTSRGRSWKPKVYDIKKMFSLGEHRWSNISKELRRVGVLKDKITQKGTELVFNPWIEKEEKLKSATPDFRGPRKTDLGKSGDITKKQLTKEKHCLNNKGAPVDNSHPKQEPEVVIDKQFVLNEASKRLRTKIYKDIVPESKVARIAEEISFHVKRNERRFTLKHSLNAALKLVSQRKWTTPKAMLGEQSIAREQAAANDKARELAEIEQGRSSSFKAKSEIANLMNMLKASKQDDESLEHYKY